MVVLSYFVLPNLLSQNLSFSRLMNLVREEKAVCSAISYLLFAFVWFEFMYLSSWGLRYGVSFNCDTP